MPTTQSSESLKTISSLLEEPDMLEQTSVRGEETRWEVDKEPRSWETPSPEQVAVWERPREDSSKEEEETGGRLEESNEGEKEVEEELSSTERRSPGEKSGSCFCAAT